MISINLEYHTVAYLSKKHDNFKHSFFFRSISQTAIVYDFKIVNIMSSVD